MQAAIHCEQPRKQVCEKNKIQGRQIWRGEQKSLPLQKQNCLSVEIPRKLLLGILVVLSAAAPAYAQGDASTASPKPKNMATQATVFIFGVADSMRDSTVYITPVQRIDSANLQKKTKFLLDRPFFSSQLKTYFASNLNDPNRLCIVYYAKGNESKAMKKLQRVRRNYLDEGALVKQLSPEEFKFEPVRGARYESVGSDEAPVPEDGEQDGN